MEEWKDIQGYEGIYMISNLGNVKGFKYKTGFKEHLLKPMHDKNGYCKVSLYKNRKMRMVSIHRLVAEAFIPNLENKPQVNHIDGDKDNNSVYNLEWCTNKENIEHAIKTGLTLNRGKYNYKAKMVVCITTNKVYECIKDAELDTGVPNQNIVKVCQGKRNYAGRDNFGNKLIWRYKEDINE